MPLGPQYSAMQSLHYVRVNVVWPSMICCKYISNAINITICNGRLLVTCTNNWFATTTNKNIGSYLLVTMRLSVQQDKSQVKNVTIGYVEHFDANASLNLSHQPVHLTN